MRAVAETEAARGLEGRVGLLCDDRYGQDALNAATGRGWWVGRPVEWPGSNPVVFEHGRSMGTALIAWPVEQVVKCLVPFHPDDEVENRLENEAQVKALYDAVQVSGHELLIEIVPPKALPAGPDVMLRAMKRLYNLGIYPEWWKLPPPAAAEWPAIDALIAERDPYCRGVVLLGLSAPIDALARGFADAAASRTLPRIRGRAHDLPRRVARVARGRARRRRPCRGRAEEFRSVDRRMEGVRSKGATAMSTIRLTMAQALVRFLAAQGTVCDGREVPLFGGVWAIFGHGNVAGIGEALYRHRAALPTYRAHNEQAMAHAAIAYAKAHFRRRMMACTTSIGPGATNLITAAATAHVNRLPVLFLPGDVFVSRAPDPVLQQVEDFRRRRRSRPTTASGRCRATSTGSIAPSQLLTALPRAIAVLTDPAQCGPVTLALPQDVQAEAYDYPEEFFAPTLVRIRAPVPESAELDAAAQLLRDAKRPLIVAGGGVLYSDGGPDGAARVSPKRIACRWRKRRPGRARCRGTTRCRPAPSA